MQITGHKRKLIAEIRKGIAGRVSIGAGEMEALIATRHKVGYMLNFARENVLILGKKDLLVLIFLTVMELDRFFSELFLDAPEVLCLC